MSYAVKSHSILRQCKDGEFASSLTRELLNTLIYTVYALSTEKSPDPCYR